VVTKFLSSALAFTQELKAAQITNLAKYSVYLFICSENNHNGDKGTKTHKLALTIAHKHNSPLHMQHIISQSVSHLN